MKIIALQGRERKLLLTNRGQSLEIIELTCQLSALEDMKVDYLAVNHEDQVQKVDKIREILTVRMIGYGPRTMDTVFCD